MSAGPPGSEDRDTAPGTCDVVEFGSSARRGDLDEIAAFLNECWRSAYSGILDAAFLASLTTADRRRRLDVKRRAGARLFTTRDPDGLLGVAMAGPSTLPGWDGAGELNILYVRSDRIGTGIGHALLQVAEDALCASGYATVVLDVFEANRRAIGFYAAHGYERKGTKVDDLGGRTYPLAIMARRLPCNDPSAA